jgi:hypothetical protein
VHAAYPQPLQLLRLRLLRDEGAVSRADPADRLAMPRPRLLAELERLAGLGYVAEAGMPVSPPIMPGWDRFPVRELLTREHGCPAVVDNNVNIMAIGDAGAAGLASEIAFGEAA